MFEFSALSQIWKKYILKLNAWDMSLSQRSSLTSNIKSFATSCERFIMKALWFVAWPVNSTLLTGQHYTVVDWVWGQHMIGWSWRWTVVRGRRQQFIWGANRSSGARKPRQQLFCYTPFTWIIFNDGTRQNDPLHNTKINKIDLYLVLF